MRKKLKMKTMYIKPTSEAIYIEMMPMMVGTLSPKGDTLHKSDTQTDESGPGIGGSEPLSGGEDLDGAKRYGWYTGEFGE